jgi:hypothetical protein
MDIIVERFPSEKDWTLSEFSILGVKRGVGVEDEKRDVKIFGETRIPNGIYEVELVYSPKFSSSYFVDANGYLSQTKDVRFNKEHSLIHVKDVPNFTSILWHWGNTDLDTHGCYLVGSSFGTVKGRKGIIASRKKYTEIYPIIYGLILNNKNKGLKTFVEYKDKA